MGLLRPDAAIHQLIQVGGYAPPQQAGGYSQYPAHGYENQPVPQIAAVSALYFGGLQYAYVNDPMVELGMSTLN